MYLHKLGEAGDAEAGDKITSLFYLFFNKRSGSTINCELQKKVQFYHLGISERA